MDYFIILNAQFLKMNRTYHKAVSTSTTSAVVASRNAYKPSMTTQKARMNHTKRLSNVTTSRVSPAPVKRKPVPRTSAKAPAEYVLDITQLNPFRSKSKEGTDPGLFKSDNGNSASSRVYAQNEILRSPSFNQAISDFSPSDPNSMQQYKQSLDISSSIMNKIHQRQQLSTNKHSPQQTQQKSQPLTLTRRPSNHAHIPADTSRSAIVTYRNNQDDSFSAKTDTPGTISPTKAAAADGKAMEGLLKRIQELSGQMKGMKRTMNHMQLSISEREAQIAELKMSLGDERQKV